MKIYNTLSGEIEEFIPQQKDLVKMYVCGITPYDEVHLGHARCYVVFDIIRRYLKYYENYKIKYIQNFTDIDDKILNKAKETNEHPFEITKKYIESYFDAEKKLNILPADFYPKVTEHIDDIIVSIEKLIKKNFAYITGTGIYFEINKFPNYGKLSKKSLSQLIAGARVEPDETKKFPLDFALWKFSKPEDFIFWDSPWGKGRPGWHIECSVMSMKYLGETLDIHGGGIDLIFPHHENETAQSEALTGKKFVNYWIHNGFVTINRQKMSKSLKNIFALKDLFEVYEPAIVRLFLISQHYQKPLDFSLQEIEQFKGVYKKFRNLSEEIELKLKNLKKDDKVKDSIKLKVDEIENKFKSALEDNLNTSLALSHLHNFVSFMFNLQTENRQDLIYSYDKFLKMLNTLGIEISKKEDIPQEIKELVLKREQARKNKDFSLADKIRKEIFERGYIIEDTKYGPRVTKK